ncbi:hypothetical protein COLO4_03873 [Corchorus olitorius]|uniref:Uncharacterized protein n=1 Tax=Corchorus olitorius TaxID=93759 RepID=A0A1R3KWC8_9ROSI|nr:hypothetical protein COLO4_03873 [Corchorus olitorius]
MEEEAEALGKNQLEYYSAYFLLLIRWISLKIKPNLQIPPMKLFEEAILLLPCFGGFLQKSPITVGLCFIEIFFAGKAMKDGDSLMDSGKLKDALSYYEKVMEKVPYKLLCSGLYVKIHLVGKGLFLTYELDMPSFARSRKEMIGWELKASTIEFEAV